jgi:Spy/CpxP family protein refolding chaperone
MIPLIAAVLSSATIFAATGHHEGAGKRHGHHWKEHAAKHWEKLKADLKLNPAQEFAWQEIADRRAALHKERHGDRAQLKEAMKQELAKAEPDFARIVRQKQQLDEKGLQARNEMREMQLKLYSSFSAEQKAVMRDAMKARMERVEQWRDKKRGAS